jgi:hypothetical protein
MKFEDWHKAYITSPRSSVTLHAGHAVLDESKIGKQR